MTNQRTIFSGIQPSGELHIGHYFGAIKNWVALQNEYRAIFCVVDEHAITVPQEPEKLRARTLDIAALYVACGIDPEKSLVFVQSHNTDHTQLGWILNTLTPLGELERMTQFKDKAKIPFDLYTELKETVEALNQIQTNNKKSSEYKNSAMALMKKIEPPELKNSLMALWKKIESTIEISETKTNFIKNVVTYLANKGNTPAGLLNYPTLMAADILLYQTDIVPVGEDQKQHIELTRTLARKFNARFGQTFKEPKELIQKSGGRIMALDDPTKKMSKSSPNTASYIGILDTPEEIKKKIKIAVTDSDTEVRFDPTQKPAIANLMAIYRLASDISIKEIEKKFAGKGYGDFKKELGEVLTEHLLPIKKKYYELRRDEKQMLEMLAKGAEAAKEISGKTLADVKQKIGFL